MNYKILIRREAKKKLQSLSNSQKSKLVEKIVMLGKNPNAACLDIKLLQGSTFFRLRVGNWRIIFERHDDIRIIAINKIKSRGDAYK